jgi:hypothetical protein
MGQRTLNFGITPAANGARPASSRRDRRLSHTGGQGGHEATKTIPIVMAPAGAPLELGLVESLARPGGNVTGLSNMEAELGGKRLEVLRDAIPGLARVPLADCSCFFSTFHVASRDAMRSPRLEAVFDPGPESPAGHRGGGRS